LHWPIRGIVLSKLPDEKSRKVNDLSDDIRSELASFPSMSRTITKLRAVFKENDPSIVKIESILRQDPGLSTNILRLANSAHFGLSSKVTSLKQAVMLLGLKRFEQIAFSASISDTMQEAIQGYDLSTGQLWLHSITVATTAEAVARFLKIDNPNDVFIPALLHDMGKLVLGKFVKRDLNKIESIVEKGVSKYRAEHIVLGTNHAEIGSLILKKWSFPADIVNAVCWHHDPEYISKTHKKLKEPTIQSDIVYLSNLIFQSLDNNDSSETKLAMPPAELLKRLGIKSDHYTMIAEKALIWMNELSNTLSFE
jgi:putative nucleotidyltransferase with HDIG domain